MSTCNIQEKADDICVFPFCVVFIYFLAAKKAKLIIRLSLANHILLPRDSSDNINSSPTLLYKPLPQQPDNRRALFVTTPACSSETHPGEKTWFARRTFQLKRYGYAYLRIQGGRK